MANKRLALVACLSDAEGPWTLAKGNETGLCIYPLNEGEMIYLDIVETDGSQASIKYGSTGILELSFERITKYRVRKTVEPGAERSPTTVEVMLNGSAKGLSR